MLSQLVRWQDATKPLDYGAVAAAAHIRNTPKVSLPLTTLLLPIFPAGSTHITQSLAFECRQGRVTYFHGQLPVFVHGEDDVRTFRMGRHERKDP